MMFLKNGLRRAYYLLVSLLFAQTLFSQPTINSFSPASGTAGISVVISGSNFNAVTSNNVVYFGAVKANVTSATATSITVTVPASASYGPISVTTNGLTAYSSNSFIATFPNGQTITSSSFADKIDLPAGETPYDIASGDLDGDGKPDIVSVNSGYPYSISVYKNISVAGNGIFSFSAKVDISTGIRPYSIDIADIDGDSKLDIVIANSYSFTISVFKNTSTPGNISFDVRKDLPAQNPDLVTIGDMNNDGKPDLIVSNFLANTISIFKNTSSPGAVSFAPRTDYGTGNSPSELAVGDIDGDSWKDIVVISDGPVAIFKNAASAQISFNVDIQTFPGVQARNIVIADLDGDNKPELGIGRDTVISIYKNTSVSGNISFATAIDVGITSFAGKMKVADLSGDGNPDIATSSGLILENTTTNSVISFQQKSDLVMGEIPSNLIIEDFDGDSKPDIASLDENNNNVIILRNQVDGPHIISFSPISETSGHTVTINGLRFEGISEVRIGGVLAQSFAVVNTTTITAVVGSGANGEISVKNSKGVSKKSGFTFIIPSSSYPVPVVTSFFPISGPIGTIVTVTGQNFDPSPNNNIVYMGAAKANILSASDTQLVIQVPRGATFAPITVTRFLLTGSSRLSFLCTFQTGPSFTRNSFGSPQLIQTLPTFDNNNSEIAVADLDGDGKLDLLFGSYIYKVARNIGTSGQISFATPVQLDQSHVGSGAELADMNGDGKLDLVWFPNTNGESFGVLKNKSSIGNILFDQGTIFPISIAGGTRGFAVKDLDLDGKPDIVYADVLGSYISVFRNTTYNDSVSFAPNIYIPTPVGPVAVCSNDLDGDGKPELVVTNYWGNSISVFQNLSTPGSILFSAPINYSFNFGPIQTILTDLDGDGKLDIAALTYDGNNVRCYKNSSSNGLISFNLATGFSTTSFPTEIRATDMNGDGKPELVCFSPLYTTISVFKNRTTESGIAFGPEAWYSQYNINGEFEIGDFDTDGKPDFVVGAQNVSIGIMRNNVTNPKIVPSGSNPVLGQINNRMTFDSTIRTFNGLPYVQRHYDIEPVNNPATSTATVTLYFNQEDFNNFNNLPGHGPDLPKYSSDIGGIANLRIFQYHGLSASSTPGTYTGAAVEINPDDANIFWEARAACWEITIDVTGFSGFFVSNSSFVPLPVTWLSINAQWQGEYQAKLTWQVAAARNVNKYIVQFSKDGRSFIDACSVEANNSTLYSCIVSANPDAKNYYRIKEVDIDGLVQYSKVVVLNSNITGNKVMIYPNPVSKILTIQATANFKEVLILDVQGRLISSFNISSNKVNIDVTKFAKGIYTMTLIENNSNKIFRKIVVN